MTVTAPGVSAHKVRSKTLNREAHLVIQEKCEISADRGEDYACVFQKGKGYGVWSIHVFSRQPTQQEIDEYEQKASKLGFKGNKAEIKGSQINAAVNLYNKIVTRAYDVLQGLREHDRLNAESARTIVPPIVKREAIRQLIAEVYSESRMAEIEGSEDEEDNKDDKEDHTSDASGDSEP